MQRDASKHVTAWSSLCGPPGLAIAAKLLPFQRSITARGPVAVSRYPTAVQFDVVTQLTPSNSAGRGTCGSGCACAVHIVLAVAPAVADADTTALAALTAIASAAATT